jgi:hypothetical protein
MAERVKRWDYCYLTATYFLLLEKKLRGLQIRLTPANSPLMEANPNRTPAPKRNLVSDMNRGGSNDSGGNFVGTPLRDSPRGLHNSLEGGLDDIDLLKIGSPPPASSKDQTPKKGENFDRSTKNRASERYPVPHKKAVKMDQYQDENKPPKSSLNVTPTK